MSERSITTRILAYLAGRRAGRAIKLHGNAYQSAGEPDILYVEGGRAFFFEVKTATGRATKLQHYRLAQWRGAGAVAEVVRSLADVQAVFAQDSLPRNEREPGRVNGR